MMGLIFTTTTHFLDDTLLLIRYASPIIVTHLLENTLVLFTIVSLGQLGTIELAAASLANITLNCSCLSFIIGFSSALDSLCSQSFSSRSDHHRRFHRTTTYALSTIIILWILVIPQSILLWNSDSILLLLLHQHPELVSLASTYLRILSFGLPAYGLFHVSRRWLQAQRRFLPPTLILILITPINLLLNYLLVSGPYPSLSLGFRGAPIATVISFNLMGILSSVYSLRLIAKANWAGFDRRVFDDLAINFRFGLSGVAIITTEWWFWEILGIASSLLGPTALAAQSVIGINIYIPSFYSIFFN